MGSEIYWHKGLVMGPPLSPALAYVYIEYFKEIALGIYITKAINVA